MTENKTDNMSDRCARSCIAILYLINKTDPKNIIPYFYYIKK